ncbi:hypothetical protein HELRODRAFT_168534 [Helobdella robusta]|uniref:Uncharacterized protein n=1 Tax=Helobdella robusta TaxID=6412 RepID=T1F0P3_HELRO|nr:hypothetical protein HELRODRAFT_168534 [Helobdella robusta]ESO09536.1 hypothetical protein HELRODRAFT_168534 [Helobdella robusta]
MTSASDVLQSKEIFDLASHINESQQHPHHSGSSKHHEPIRAPFVISKQALESTSAATPTAATATSSTDALVTTTSDDNAFDVKPETKEGVNPFNVIKSLLCLLACQQSAKKSLTELSNSSLFNLNIENSILEKQNKQINSNDPRFATSPTRMSSDEQSSRTFNFNQQLQTLQHDNNSLIYNSKIRPCPSQNSIKSLKTTTYDQNNGFETVKVTNVISSAGFTKSISTIISSINKSVSSAFNNLITNPEHQQNQQHYSTLDNDKNDPSFQNQQIANRSFDLLLTKPNQRQQLPQEHSKERVDFLKKFHPFSPTSEHKQSSPLNLSHSPSASNVSQQSHRHLNLTSTESSPLPNIYNQQQQQQQKQQHLHLRQQEQLQQLKQKISPTIFIKQKSQDERQLIPCQQRDSPTPPPSTTSTTTTSNIQFRQDSVGSLGKLSKKHPETFGSSDLTGRSRSPSPNVVFAEDFRRTPQAPRKPIRLNLESRRTSKTYEDRMPHVLTSPTALQPDDMDMHSRFQQRPDPPPEPCRRDSLNFPLLDPSPSHSSIKSITLSHSRSEHQDQQLLHNKQQQQRISPASDFQKHSPDIDDISRCSSSSQLQQQQQHRLPPPPPQLPFQPRSQPPYIIRSSRIPMRGPFPQRIPRSSLNFPPQRQIRPPVFGEGMRPPRGMIPRRLTPEHFNHQQQQHLQRSQLQQRLKYDTAHQTHSLPRSFKEVKTRPFLGQGQLESRKPVEIKTGENVESDSDDGDGDWC